MLIRLFLIMDILLEANHSHPNDNMGSSVGDIATAKKFKISIQRLPLIITQNQWVLLHTIKIQYLEQLLCWMKLKLNDQADET